MSTGKVIVYKVVHIDKGRRVSGFVWDERELVLEYKQNKVVAPAVGKCFAFSSLGSARDWGYGNEIWEAETTEALRIRRRIFTSLSNILCNINDFWKGKVKGSNVAPPGTVLCPSLKLLKMVAHKHDYTRSWTVV